MLVTIQKHTRRYIWFVSSEVRGMTAEERQQMHALCRAIQTENNHQKFSELVQQLSELLSGEDGPLIQAGSPAAIARNIQKRDE